MLKSWQMDSQILEVAAREAPFLRLYQIFGLTGYANFLIDSHSTLAWFGRLRRSSENANLKGCNIRFTAIHMP